MFTCRLSRATPNVHRAKMFRGCVGVAALLRGDTGCRTGAPGWKDYHSNLLWTIPRMSNQEK
jgi:hypothetical protein